MKRTALATIFGMLVTTLVLIPVGAQEANEQNDSRPLPEKIAARFGQAVANTDSSWSRRREKLQLICWMSA